MNLHLPKYREVKDKFCVGYFGPCNEYVTLLLGLRKLVEAELPGLRVYIGCREDLCGPENTVPESEVMRMTREPWGTGFGHIREIRCNMKDHPVEAFFAESKIAIRPTADHQPDPDNRVVRLYPNGTSPTRSLTDTQTQAIAKRYAKDGYVVRQDGPWDDAGIVVGVESTSLWEAAMAGKSVVLCDTGLGTALFRVICPWGTVISV